MEQCIQGILKDKCVVLVTHHTQYLQNASQIITLGPTTEDTSSELVSNKELTIDELFDIEKTEDRMPTNVTDSGNRMYGTFRTGVQEIRSVGRISFRVIVEYLKAGNSCWGLILSLLLFLTFQAFITGSDLWLKVW
jgi:hypothetical protein